MNKRLLPLLAILLAAPVPALTEQEAVLFAMAKSPDLRILSLGLASDSLAHAQVESETGLTLILSGDRLVEIHPNTALSWNSGDTIRKTLSSALSLSAGKMLVGGGAIKASAANSINQDLDTRQADHAIRYSLSVTQPLLKGAFGKSDTEYRVKVGRIGLKTSAEKFRGQVELLVTDARQAYWTWVQATETARIRDNERTASETELNYARARFLIGEKSEIDTLSAALETLRADEKAMSARSDEVSAREALALLLGISPDSVALPEKPAQTTLSPPSLAELTDAAVRNDAGLRALFLSAEAIQADRARAGNSLLPRVDLEAGITADRFGTRLFSGNGATAALPNSADPYAGIRFSFDLLNRRDRLFRAAAEVRLAANAADRERARLALESQLRGLLRSWAEDTARLAIRRAEIRIADKGYTQTRKSYELGALDNLALIKARNDLYSAQLNLLYTRLSLKKTETALDRLTGQSLNKFGVTLK